MFKPCDVLQWSLEEPLETATIIGPGKKPLPVPADLLAFVLPIQSGDRVLLGDTGITAPIRPGPNTFGHLLRSIEVGLQERLSNESSEATRAVYKSAGKFHYKDDRLMTVRKFEAGNLKPKHVLGEAIYFRGGLRRSDSSGVWSYKVSED